MIKEVQSVGWILVSVNGSHHKFKRHSNEKPLIIPHPKKDLGVGITSKLRKQAGL
ncbi:type II toxin-antitoxin system HicA family toxin [Photobacterium toruni]|uniref:Type II toxin-antitoxin system HicA family toxin n=1 Tax=Photobacterium toruni TaxID=1935446 RepID=A0ABU6LDI6_9GAMM|nr:type II toxin-antitoxin system HicA family toxin [Photobacterium toruni]